MPLNLPLTITAKPNPNLNHNTNYHPLNSPLKLQGLAKMSPLSKSVLKLLVNLDSPHYVASTSTHTHTESGKSQQPLNKWWALTKGNLFVQKLGRIKSVHPTHPAHHLFQLLPSGSRYKSPPTNTNWFQNRFLLSATRRP